MSFHPQLPLPGSELFVARAAEREGMRAELHNTLNWISARLMSMPVQDPVRMLLTSSELYVMRQGRACNPDTVLMQRLLANQREFLQFFADQPKHLIACQRIEAMVNNPTAPQMKLAEAEQDTFALHHIGVRRMETALSLANSIWSASHLFFPAVHLAIAALVLRQLLEPQHPQVEKFDDLCRTLERCSIASTTAAAEAYFSSRKDAGYQFLPDTDESGPTFAVHKDGALSITVPGCEPNEIDLSLVTDDRECFPDPGKPARLLYNDSGIPTCLYTDHRGIGRELNFDTSTDRYILSA